MEDKTLGGGTKDGGKEERREGDWVSLNTLSLKKTKIWQDYSTSLELKRGEERELFCVFWNEREDGGLYSNGGENMNGMSFNKNWQRIMNVDLILAIREIRVH